MTETEKLMYTIMGKLSEGNLPLVFKGALITKMILEKNGLNNLIRETKDIDANWTGEPPTMQTLVETINELLGENLTVLAYREYGVGQSAGLKIIEKSTNNEIVKMDIDVKPVLESCKYWYGETTFNGTTINQIMSDKLASLSSDRIFRRVKDMVDIYALSQCVAIQTKDIFEVTERTGRKIEPFISFSTRKDELQHAYNKLRGINEKPDFEKVYSYLKKFVQPFAEKSPECLIWDGKKESWYKKEKTEKQQSQRQKKRRINELER